MRHKRRAPSMQASLDNCIANAKNTPMKSTAKRIELNWSKLLGFKQVRSQEKKQAKAVLAAKIGGKPGGGGGEGA
jgi:hypothetical protein